MLGTSTDGLHRGPHIFALWKQVPACRKETVRFDSAAFVDPLWGPTLTTSQRLAPGDIAIPLYDRIRRPVLKRLVRIKGRVDSAEDCPGSTLLRQPADLITAQGIAGVDADANHVTGLNSFEHERLERLVNNPGRAERTRGCCCKHIQPTRGNYSCSE